MSRSPCFRNFARAISPGEDLSSMIVRAAVSRHLVSSCGSASNRSRRLTTYEAPCSGRDPLAVRGKAKISRTNFWRRSGERLEFGNADAARETDSSLEAVGAFHGPKDCSR